MIGRARDKGYAASTLEMVPSDCVAVDSYCLWEYRRSESRSERCQKDTLKISDVNDA